MKDLNECRVTINEIDLEMKKLFLKRRETVLDVVRYKMAHDLPTYDPSREAEMKTRLTNDLEGYIKEEYLAFLEEILYLSKKAQDKERVK